MPLTPSVLRPLGRTEIRVSPVALGCWPISGMTSLEVNDRDSLATLHACADVGINFLDTAYGYGADGESEQLIAQALGPQRDQFVIATKCGLHWGTGGQRVLDGRPERLRVECERSLQRLKTDRVDLLYLHAPDPQVPVAESAGGLKALQDDGKTRAVGASNLDLEQLQAFHAVCPLAAYQPPYNMLQRDIEDEILPWCRSEEVAVVVYWPLMKGLLAGRLHRDHVFPPEDGRAKYALFQGREWQRNMDLVDALREIAEERGKPVAELVINWTIHQPGITAALCGAKRPGQIAETAAAMSWRLSDEEVRRIDRALAQRGAAATRWAV